MRVGNGHSGQGRQPGQSLGQRGRASGKRKGLCIGGLAPKQDGAGEWGASGQKLQKAEGQWRPVKVLGPSNLSIWEQGPGVQGHHQLHSQFKASLTTRGPLSNKTTEERRWSADLVKG